MAALALRSSIFSLPAFTSQPLHSAIRTSPILQRKQTSIPFPHSIAVPILALSGISSWISDIWGSILKAVPKKKTSHMKLRHRQMAGKALKDVTNLNKCSSCGRTKRSHIICPYCALAIKNWVKGKLGQAQTTQA